MATTGLWGYIKEKKERRTEQALDEAESLLLEARKKYADAEMYKYKTKLEFQCQDELSKYEHDYHLRKQELNTELARLEGKLEAKKEYDNILRDVIDDKEKTIDKLCDALKGGK